jgi:hypothetical protein
VSLRALGMPIKNGFSAVSAVEEQPRILCIIVTHGTDDFFPLRFTFASLREIFL